MRQQYKEIQDAKEQRKREQEEQKIASPSANIAEAYSEDLSV